MRRNILGIAIVLLCASAAVPARAQDPEQQVRSLLDQARQAYEQNLDISGAQGFVDQAIAIVQQYHGTGAIAAQAYGMRGVIYLWLGDPDKAGEMFRAALQLDPGLQLPQAWGGPDVNRALRDAAASLHQGAPPPNVGGPNPPPPPPPNVGGPVPPPPPPPNVGGPVPPPPPIPQVPATRFHAVTEQLWNHPVPIYVETNPALRIAGVYLYYRTDSDSGFQMMELGRAGPGYYGEIPCTMIQPTRWYYYLVVVDTSGNAIGGDGSPQSPYELNMATAGLQGPAPTRPDGTLAPSCGPNGEAPATSDCPPGISCHGVICEHSCAIASDCSSDEVCILGCCKEPVAQETTTSPLGASSYAREGIGLWLHLSLGLGVGIPHGPALEPKWYTNATGTWYGPDDALHSGMSRATDRQVTSINGGLALSGFAARLGIGYNVLPFLSVELNYRFSAPFDTTHFPWLVEARIAYWFLTGPTHMVSAYLGGGAGVMTHMIPRVVFNQEYLRVPDAPLSKVYEPFYKASGYGAIAVGAQYRYCFNDMFALGGELAMNAMLSSSFNSFSWNFDFLIDGTVMF